ncbi:hypothetical protein DFH09DRAFT_1070307 [Mycena vulgaris]|nr:hypothetical protein DFH09DRAFT_1070307 [Mycena vulgaris]
MSDRVRIDSLSDFPDCERRAYGGAGSNAQGTLSQDVEGVTNVTRYLARTGDLQNLTPYTRLHQIREQDPQPCKGISDDASFEAFEAAEAAEKADRLLWAQFMAYTSINYIAVITWKFRRAWPLQIMCNMFLENFTEISCSAGKPELDDLWDHPHITMGDVEGIVNSEFSGPRSDLRPASDIFEGFRGSHSPLVSLSGDATRPHLIVTVVTCEELV